MELAAGIEPATSSLPRKCPTPGPRKPNLPPFVMVSTVPVKTPKWLKMKHWGCKNVFGSVHPRRLFR